MDVYSTLVTYHEDCIHNAPAIKWLSLIDFYICDDFLLHSSKNGRNFPSAALSCIPAVVPVAHAS